MKSNPQTNPEPERFEVYLAVPNAPATEVSVTQAEADEILSRTGRFIDERNAWCLGDTLKKEIKSLVLG